MKIIFFDIDGVINHANTRGTMDWDIVDRLIKMANEFNAKFVMSSSWKDVLINPTHYSAPDRHFVTCLCDEMGDLFLGWTPDIAEDDREIEIQAWLDEHPEVENFVILDDLEFGLKEHFGKHFIKTTGWNNEGFSLDNEKEARLILEKDCYDY